MIYKFSLPTHKMKQLGQCPEDLNYSDYLAQG